MIQMSAGIAETGMRWAGADQPTPLRARTDAATTARASLARTAALLAPRPLENSLPPPESWVSVLSPEHEDFGSAPEPTAWGPARRLRPPLTIDGTPMHWTIPAGPLRTSTPRWRT